MTNSARKAVAILLVLTLFGLLLANSTSPVNAYAIVSDSAVNPAQQAAAQHWTWTEFGKNVVVGSIAGAVAGAVVAFFGTPAITVAAGVGSLSGAAAGAVTYAGNQAWDCYFGPQPRAIRPGVNPVNALD